MTVRLQQTDDRLVATAKHCRDDVWGFQFKPDNMTLGKVPTPSRTLPLSLVLKDTALINTASKLSRRQNLTNTQTPGPDINPCPNRMASKVSNPPCQSVATSRTKCFFTSIESITKHQLKAHQRNNPLTPCEQSEQNVQNTIILRPPARTYYTH